MPNNLPPSGLLSGQPLQVAPRFGGVNMNFNPQMGNPLQAGLGGLLRMASRGAPPPQPQPVNPDAERHMAELLGLIKPQGATPGRMAMRGAM